MLILLLCLFARRGHFLCVDMILKTYYSALIWHSYLFHMWILSEGLFLRVMNLFVILVFKLIKSVTLFVILGLFFAKNLVVFYVLKPKVLHALFFVFILVDLVFLINLLNITYANRINVLKLITFLKFLLFLSNFIRTS